MQLWGRRCSKGECFNATMRCYCIIRITRHTNATDNIGIHQYWFIYIPYKICGVNHCAIHVLIIIDRMPLPAINSQVRCTVMQNRSCSARDGFESAVDTCPASARARPHALTHMLIKLHREMLAAFRLEKLVRRCTAVWIWPLQSTVLASPRTPIHVRAYSKVRLLFRAR
jgi:hypothetical protein